MEIKDYFKIIKKRILLILLITLICTFASAVVSYFVIKPVYKADIKVAIDSTNSSKEQKENYNDVIMYQKMVKSYSVYATSKVVANDVIKELKLNLTAEQLISMISVTPSGDTEFLSISVKSKDKDQATKIANQLAVSLKNITKDIKNSDNVKIVDPAVAPNSPYSPKPLLNIAIAFVVGVMISVGSVFLIEYLDSTVKNEEEIQKITGYPVVGVIPVFDEK